MKKKIVAILLCVLIVCSLCVAFVACNNDDNNQGDALLGCWVGYKQGDINQKQYFMNCSSGSSNLGTDYSIKTYHAGISAENKVWVSGSDLAVYGIGYKLETKNSYSLKLMLTDFEFKNGLTSQYNGLISNQRLVIEDENNNVFIFKKSNLSYNEWEQVAFVKDENDIYKPYYYED